MGRKGTRKEIRREGGRNKRSEEKEIRGRQE
jgi:hypothetical protein